MNRRTFAASIAALPAAFSNAAPSAKGPARLRSAICAYSFRKELGDHSMRYEDLVPLAVETGVDGLDLTVYWFPSTEDSFLMPLRREAYRAAVEIYSISVRTEMCRPTPELRESEIAGIHKWVDVAAKLGAGHIRVFGGSVPKGASEDQAAGWCTEVLKQAADYAGTHGVILGLENHGGITEKASRIVQIVRAVDSPWVGVNLDSGNFRQDAYRQMEMCAPYAVNVQFKTEVRGEGGKEEPADWDRTVGILLKAGYKGYIALEYERNDPARQAVPPLLKDLRGVIARHA